MLDSAVDCLECNYQSYKNLNRVIACEAEIISGIWTRCPHSSFPYPSVFFKESVYRDINAVGNKNDENW